MSFNNYARGVRDTGLSPWRRLSKLRSAIRMLAWLTHERYGEALARLDAEFHFDRRRETGGDPPSDETLNATITAIEVERNRFLERQRAFDRARIRRKARGHRQLSRAEREAVRAFSPRHPAAVAHAAGAQPQRSE